MTSTDWDDFVRALGAGVPEIGDDEPPKSLVEDVFVDVHLPEAFRTNVVVLTAHLSPEARAELGAGAIRRGLSEGLCVILSAGGHLDSAMHAMELSACVDEESDVHEVATELTAFARSLALEDDRSRVLVYSAIELARLGGGETSASTAFGLVRAIQLQASAPESQLDPASAGGLGASTGVRAFGTGFSSKTRDPEELARVVGVLLSAVLRREGKRVQAALALMASEVDVYLGPGIPPRKLRSAVDTFEVEPESIRALIDLTVFGSARNCLIVLDDEVRFRNDWSGLTPGVHRVRFDSGFLGQAKLAKRSEVTIVPDLASVSMSGSSFPRERLLEVLAALESTSGEMPEDR